MCELIRNPEYFFHSAGWMRTPTECPALRGFWDFKKTALCEVRISGTVGGPLMI